MPPALDRLLWPMLDGLERVHSAGFLHRDIKPANVLLRADGRPTLIDFGASRAAVAGRTTAMTAIFTPGYAAPEQMSTAKQGPWTDIYGLAATLYHAITGKPPPSAFDRVLDDEYEPIVGSTATGWPEACCAASMPASPSALANGRRASPNGGHPGARRSPVPTTVASARHAVAHHVAPPVPELPDGSRLEARPRAAAAPAKAAALFAGIAVACWPWPSADISRSSGHQAGPRPPGCRISRSRISNACWRSGALPMLRLRSRSYWLMSRNARPRPSRRRGCRRRAREGPAGPPEGRTGTGATQGRHGTRARPRPASASRPTPPHARRRGGRPAQGRGRDGGAETGRGRRAEGGRRVRSQRQAEEALAGQAERQKAETTRGKRPKRKRGRRPKPQQKAEAKLARRPPTPAEGRSQAAPRRRRSREEQPKRLSRRCVSRRRPPAPAGGAHVAGLQHRRQRRRLRSAHPRDDHGLAEGPQPAADRLPYRRAEPDAAG